MSDWRGTYLAIYMRIPEVRGKISKRRAQPEFLQQNRRSRKRKTGVWSADLGFSPHFRILKTEVCGKFRNLGPHCPLRVKKPQVEALPFSGVLGISDICRILPEITSRGGLPTRGDCLPCMLKVKSGHNFTCRYIICGLLRVASLRCPRGISIWLLRPRRADAR